MPKLVTEGMGGQITSTKFVNKLGFAGVENEFDIPKYYALNSIWDSGHADTIMGGFRYSTLKKH